MATTLPRITARVDNETQSLLQRAAALSGVTSINSFVLNAAVEKAKMIVDRESQLVLNAKDANELAAALDRAPRKLTKLSQAGKRYAARME